MKCNEIKNELMLLSQNSEMSASLKEHLSRCRKCKEFYEETSSLFENLGSDNLFSLSDSESEKLISNINLKLDHKKPAIPLFKYLSMAAALILVLGVTYIARQTGEFERGNSNNYSNSDSINNNENLANNTDGDDEMYGLYFEQLELENSETDELWYYLSDEDFEYLEDNFDVKELLL